MRLALFQTAGDPSNRAAANLDRLDEAAARAAADGANLLLAPEMFLCGYNIGAAAASDAAEPADGPSARRAAEIAHRHGIALCYGYAERGADGTVYNSALLIDASGAARANYRKTHLFGELDRGMFVPGTAPSPVVELGGLKIGLAICYDVEFPELVRDLALAGADLVLVPTANMAPFTAVSELLVPARAFENELYVAYANRVGREGELTYLGMSCVGAPAGGNLVLGDGEERLLFAEIDPADLQAARSANSHLMDRRPDLYGRLLR